MFETIREAHPPAGPRGVPLLGNLPTFARDPIGFFDDIQRDYGDIVPYYIGTSRFWSISSPAAIEEVLIANASRLHKDLATRAIRRLLGHGLLTNENPHWKKQRKLASPSFTPRQIAAYAEVMVDVGTRSAERVGAAPDQPRDILHDMTEATLEIVLRTLFGTFDDTTEQAGRAIGTFMQAFEAEMRTVFRLLPRWVPTQGRTQMAEARQLLVTVLDQIIEARRTSGEERDDLLGRLLAARDEDGVGMSDVQLKDEAITVFAAGHETTALMMTYAFWLLAQHPEVQEQLWAEVDAVTQGEPLTLAHVERLVWHDAVIKETMRLYPPAWVIGRLALEPFTVGGHAIAEGDQLLIPTRVVHRDPRHFIGPEAFRPVRWRNGETEPLPRFAYFPFGGGPRVCIGNHFAILEGKLLLAAWTQRLRVRPDPSLRLELAPMITLRPRNETIPLYVSPREA